MNREILFRGKRADNGEWIEGFYSIDTICCKGDFYLAPVIRKKPQKLFDTDWDEVIPSTAGQYTGLTDKNGRKIFDGDILKNWDGKKYTVIYDSHSGSFCFKNDALLAMFRICGFEVLGNIFDNPELIGEQP